MWGEKLKYQYPYNRTRVQHPHIQNIEKKWQKFMEIIVEERCL